MKSLQYLLHFQESCRHSASCYILILHLQPHEGMKRVPVAWQDKQLYFNIVGDSLSGHGRHRRMVERPWVGQVRNLANRTSSRGPRVFNPAGFNKDVISHHTKLRTQLRWCVGAKVFRPRCTPKHDLKIVHNILDCEILFNFLDTDVL